MESLANKYRPYLFSSVVGQKPIVASLKGKLATGNIPKASLFWGVRGTGKTTVARIVSKAVNCENPTEDGPCCKCKSCLAIDQNNSPDVIELDAASRNKVSDVEAIIENASFIPFGKKKVIILDEVHMLTTPAFNKLLKTVEEPPQNCIFIFCTTEREKVPATILSRCNQFEFRKISDEDILANLEKICNAENILYDKDALSLITKAGDGSVRDSISILEQLSFGNTISADIVSEALGLTTDEAVFSILTAISEREPQIAISYLSEIMSGGKNIVSFLHDMIDALIDVINIHNGLSIHSMVVTKDYREYIGKLAASITTSQANNYIKELTNVLSSGKAYGLDFSTQIAVLRIIEQEQAENVLLERIQRLEEEVELLKQNNFNPSCAVENSFVQRQRVEPCNNTPQIAEPVLKPDEVVRDTFIGANISEIPFDTSDILVPGMDIPPEKSVPQPKPQEPPQCEPATTFGKIIPMERISQEEPRQKDPKQEEPGQKEPDFRDNLVIPGGIIISSEKDTAPDAKTEKSNNVTKTSKSSAQPSGEDKDLPSLYDFDNFENFGSLTFSSLARQS